jgi:hypothetical protein
MELMISSNVGEGNLFRLIRRDDGSLRRLETEDSGSITRLGVLSGWLFLCRAAREFCLAERGRRSSD